jgi:glucokinase
MRVIAGDIGGTKTLLQLLEVEPGRRETLREARFESRRYKLFDDLLRELVGTAGDEIDVACFAVAGPVIDMRAEVTNLAWVMEAAALERAFGIAKVVLLNDFYAVAAAIPVLRDDDLVVLNQGRRDIEWPVAILGAGTGLGEAFVVEDRADGWRVIPSEGGHSDFAPRNEIQRELHAELESRFGHVSYERVLSGAGLVNIFDFLRSRQPLDTQQIALDDRRDLAASIAALAHEGYALAKEAAGLFIDIYGAEAGNLALKVLPRGGVYIAGGIACKNLDWFTDGRFMRAFADKGRLGELLLEFPVEAICNSNVGLIGAAEIAIRSLPVRVV